MIDSIFENLSKKQTIAERLAAVRGRKTWEQTSLELYSILGGIHIEDSLCKEKAASFRVMVERMQARRNAFLFEAVATIGQKEDMLRTYYKKMGILNGALTNSTWVTEDNQKKFWLLTDGSYVPVRNSHNDTANDAGVSSNYDLYDEGAYAGYISDDGTLGLRRNGEADFTPEQLNTLMKMYDKYSIDGMYCDFLEYLAPITNRRAFSQVLRTGKSREKEAWEAVATEVDPAKALLKKWGYLKGKLVKSKYAGEPWYKFWMLKDGTVLPVVYSHDQTAADAGTDLYVAHDAGLADGYVEPSGSFNINIKDKLTSQQISRAKMMFAQYKIKELYLQSDSDFVTSDIGNVQKFEYELTYGLDEAVATELSPTQKMQKKYAKTINTKLKPCSWPTEKWLKFFILKTGDIVPVESSHMETHQAAGIQNPESLEHDGGYAGWIKPHEFGVAAGGVRMKINPKQMAKLKRMYAEHKPPTLYFNRDVTPITHIGEFEYVLEYGQLDESIYTSPDDFINRVAQDVIGKPYGDATREEAELVRKEIPNYNPDAIKYKADRGTKLIPAHERVDEGNLEDHAERELRLAGLFDEDSDYNGMLGEAVLELMQAFGDQGHSGFSAALTIDLFKRLASFEALTELTNNPDEWNDISEYQGGEPGWQSARMPSCFSTDGGVTYYDLDELKVEHEDEDGSSYCTYEGDKVFHTSKVYVA